LVIDLTTPNPIDLYEIISI